jgi:hypothetical protein
VADENASPYLSRTMSTLYPNTKLNKTELKQANKFNAINGLISSNPGDLIIKNQSVEWHLLGWGTYWDVQFVKWEKGQVIWSDTVIDHVRLMPASFKTVTLKSDLDGNYTFGSLDNDKRGMVMQYTIYL